MPIPVKPTKPKPQLIPPDTFVGEIKVFCSVCKKPTGQRVLIPFIEIQQDTAENVGLRIKQTLINVQQMLVKQRWMMLKNTQLVCCTCLIKNPHMDNGQDDQKLSIGT